MSIKQRILVTTLLYSTLFPIFIYPNILKLYSIIISIGSFIEFFYNIILSEINKFIRYFFSFFSFYWLFFPIYISFIIPYTWCHKCFVYLCRITNMAD